jgi:hypothetical protein
MKSFLLCISLILSSFLCGQTNNEICLTGQVVDINKKSIYKGIAVVLKINDTILVKSLINANGSYTLYTDRKTLTNNECKLYAYQQTRNIRTDLPDECWNQYEFEDEYLTVTLIKLIPPFQDTITNVLKMTKLLRCGWDFPSINFKENLLEFSKIDGNINEDSVLTLLKCIIAKNNFVIEIAGHADLNEKNPDKLSVERAERIKAKLIKRGVQEQMLVAKGYGNKRVVVTKEEIKKVKNKKEENALRQKNRRVVFWVLRKYNVQTDTELKDDED